MAGYSGIRMSNNAAEAYNEGRKPVSSITKEDILNHGINESIAFFRWYVKNFCRSGEWHHTSARYNETTFYDIEECCNHFKKANIDDLKVKYKEHKSRKKSQAENAKNDENYSDSPCYAKINYSISTLRGKRIYFEDVYCILHKCWAYIKDDYNKKVIKKNINGQNIYIAEKYQSRPDEMPEAVSN